MNKIVIPLNNGYKLVAEQNTDSEYNKEIFVGIESESGSWFQDLVVVRPTYKLDKEHVEFSSDKFEVLVFGNGDEEDFTDHFEIGLAKDDE